LIDDDDDHHDVLKHELWHVL